MNTIGDVLPYVRLKFNIDNIDLEDCYAEGYEHACHHQEESENPFQLDSLEAEHWSLGWWDGYYAQQPVHETAISTQSVPITHHAAMNEANFSQEEIEPLFYRILKISGAIFASAIIGYQILDLVA